MKELYNCYSLKLAKYLIKKGWELIAAKACEENPSKVIFRFEDSPELREDVKNYSEACKEYFGGEQ